MKGNDVSKHKYTQMKNLQWSERERFTGLKNNRIGPPLERKQLSTGEGDATVWSYKGTVSHYGRKNNSCKTKNTTEKVLPDLITHF